MSILDLIDRYGIPAALLVVIIVGLLPAVRDKLIPAIIQIMTGRDEFQRQIELRRVESAERTDANMSRLALAMELVLQNQQGIRDREDDILQTLNTAIERMTETVADRKGYERGKKEHKIGDTGPLSDDAEKAMTEYQIVIDAWGGQPLQDMPLLKSGGVGGVLLRLNDMNGGHHMDEGFWDQWTRAGDAGLLRAPYFVYNPWVNGQANFDWLLAHMPQTQLVMIDIEVAYSAVSPSAYAKQVSIFLDLVALHWGFLIYTGGWFLQYLSAWPRVDYDWASYPASMYPADPVHWSFETLRAHMDALTVPFNVGECPGTMRLWQCSGDRIIVPGTSHPIDVNLFRGSVCTIAGIIRRGRIASAAPHRQENS